MSARQPAPSPLTRVRRFGSGCLRQVATEVDPAAPGTCGLLDEMWRVLAVEDGVGLAAPQVGASLRVVVIRNPKRSADWQRVELINPVINETFGPDEPFEEGCLSFPGLYTMVRRPRGVEISYQDRAGQKQTIRDEGLLARIVQHEVDHLDGVLFLDHLSSWQRMFLGPRLLLIVLGKLLGK